MMTILLIILIIVLLGGGGGYYAHGRYGGAGLGGVLRLGAGGPDRSLAHGRIDGHGWTRSKLRKEVPSAAR